MSTRGYTELLLYGLLLFSLLLHKLFQLPNLSLVFLLLPLSFLPAERFGLKSPWNASLLCLPFLYPLYPQAFLSLALQAFAEELFFRAYLMGRFSNLMVSLMFVVPHVLLYGDLWSWLTFFPSLLYGFAYSRTSSLALASVLHLGSNVLWFGFISQELSNLSSMSLRIFS